MHIFEGAYPKLLRGIFGYALPKNMRLSCSHFRTFNLNHATTSFSDLQPKSHKNFIFTPKQTHFQSYASTYWIYKILNNLLYTWKVEQWIQRNFLKFEALGVVEMRSWNEFEKYGILSFGCCESLSVWNETEWRVFVMQVINLIWRCIFEKSRNIKEVGLFEDASLKPLGSWQKGCFGHAYLKTPSKYVMWLVQICIFEFWRYFENVTKDL